MLSIGPFRLGNPVCLAPMECYSNAPFRALAREMGAAWATTEMARAEAVVRRVPSALSLLAHEGQEHPIAGQIVGSNPGVCAEAARIIEGMGFDAVDLNFGCPSRRVRAEEAGGFLLLHPGRVGAIVEAVARAVKVPVTVKMRCGFDEERVTVAEVVRSAESAGASWVAIHARTVKQGYSGKALWHRIGEAKAAIRIPVLGNGDVRSQADLDVLRKETGCDGVLIARAAMGNPWIFRELRLDGSPGTAPPSREDVVQMMDRHLGLLEEILPPRPAAHLFALHAFHYAKRLPHPSAFRRALSGRWHPDGLRTLFRTWPESAARSGARAA
jgi:nifR3 family TIM-barrel protein